jgi:hypothetical protein
VQLDSEFYNNVCALLPLMMLTKVVDRHRRHYMGEIVSKEQAPMWRRKARQRHRVFLVLAAATEALALLSAGWDHGNALADWLLIGLVAVCGAFFTVEVVIGDLAEE